MILRGLRDTLEAHHKVTITDEAIIAAAELSDRYITGRYLPDKAIDLIDQAAARVKISATARPVDVQELEAEVEQIKRELDYASARKQFDRAAELKKELEEKQKELDELLEIWKRDRASATAEVRADHVAQIVSKLTGVPVSELTTEEKEKLLKLEEKLHERVIGQDEAIHAVAGPAGARGPARRLRPDRDLPLPRPHRRRQDRTRQDSGGGHFRRRGCAHPHRHVGIWRAPCGCPSGRCASRLCRLRGGWTADREGPPPALFGGAA